MLRDKDEGFRLLFVENPLPMWVFDTDTYAFLEVNKAAEKKYGYSRDEFLSMRITEIRPPEDIPRVLRAIGEEAVTLERRGKWRHKLRDGRIIDVEVAAQALLFGDRPAQLVIAQDITDQTIAERALAVQARQFALVANMAVKALSGTHVDELMHIAVEKVADELDVPLTKVLALLPDGAGLLMRAGVGWNDAYRPGEAIISDGLESQAGYTLQSNEPVVVEDLRHERRFSGPPLLTEHQVVSGVSIVIPGSEQPFGVLGVHTTRPRHFESHEVVFVQTIANILATAIERARADERLRASESRFRAVVQNALHMVTIVNSEGIILYDSPPVKRILGYDPQERVGDNIMAYLHPEDMGEVMVRLGELTTNGAAQAKVQVRVRHRDGSWRHVEASGANLTDHDALRGIVVNWHDVTDRVYAQKQVERLNNELEERVRQRTAQLQASNEELEAFAYTVSHDLRAPLRAIDGFARILSQDAQASLPPAAQRYLERIRINAQQMDMLIQDLLEFAHLNRQSLSRRPVDMQKIVREALAQLETERNGRATHIDVQPMPPALADRAMVKLVFSNLLSNALKYTRPREQARIEVGARRDPKHGARNIYYVRDNGVGFDMKYVSKVFGVFQRLHKAEEYEGTGVGLATVQRIVRRHGGEVWIESAVDGGTTVYFTFEEASNDGRTAG